MVALATGLVAGGLLSASLTWMLGGLVDWIPQTAASYIVGLVAVGVVLRDLRIVTIPLPERHWQVPKSVLDQAPPRAALGFGMELGLGFRTYVSASAPYLLLVALLLLAGPLPLYLLCGVAFGLGRFVMAAGRYVSGDSEVWSARIGLRASRIRSFSAVLAALSAMALGFAWA